LQLIFAPDLAPDLARAFPCLRRTIFTLDKSNSPLNANMKRLSYHASYILTIRIRFVLTDSKFAPRLYSRGNI